MKKFLYSLLAIMLISFSSYSQSYTCEVDFAVNGYIVKTKNLTIRNNETLTTSFYHGDDRYTVELDVLYEDGIAEYYVDVYKNGSRYCMANSGAGCSPSNGFMLDVTRGSLSFSIIFD